MNKSNSASRLILAAALCFIATLSMGSALAQECMSIPVRADNEAYQGCEVIHGTEYKQHTAEEMPEEACAHVCDSLNEMDAMAAESRKLDNEAGF